MAFSINAGKEKMFCTKALALLGLVFSLLAAGCEGSVLSGDWTDSSITDYLSGKTFFHQEPNTWAGVGNWLSFRSDGTLEVEVRLGTIEQGPFPTSGVDKGRWFVQNRRIVTEMKTGRSSYKIVKIGGDSLFIKSMGGDVEGEYVGPSDEVICYFVE